MRSGGLDTILLVAPDDQPARAAGNRPTEAAFCLYLSVSGITGERARLPADLLQTCALRAYRPAGLRRFGISNADARRRVARASRTARSWAALT